jgi:hypothetical protein
VAVVKSLMIGERSIPSFEKSRPFSASKVIRGI